VAEFHKWRCEVAQLLTCLAETAPLELAAELEELRKLVERADYRELPRALAKMAALALLEPELKQYLPDSKTAERWMAEERNARLEIVRRYARAAGGDKVVVHFFRWDALHPATYEYFTLLEKVQPGLPISQRVIEGLPMYRLGASMTVVDKDEFLKRFKGKRLMVVVHIASELGEEYFIEELDAEELFADRHA